VGHPLDGAAWASLSGEHRRFAETYGQAARYDPEVAPFHALPPDPDGSAWADLAKLAGPGSELTLNGPAVPLPAGWEVIRHLDGVQLVGDDFFGEPDAEAVPLGLEDVPEVLDLVARTEPGPFRKRTIELGTYLGIRRDGRLIAMAGERMHPPGWTEISAVCTDPAYRGQGLAGRLMRAVAAGIRARGETPFLHAAATNTSAIRLYESLGFTFRRHTAFRLLRVP
jgi:ribosomal protein S18 acetylase RimI-like enzyme